MYNNIRATELAESANHVPPKWKKGRLLGRGTFGHVYLGFNSENGQMCAMKEVRLISDDQTSKESLKQLNQEISLLSQLSHPNIVQYYGCELGEEALSVYLEYVSGGSIYKLLQEYGTFKESVIQNYTRKILSGLAYLHGKNTVHRTLYAHLNHCVTAFGKRLLKTWLARPLYNLKSIKERQDAFALVSLVKKMSIDHPYHTIFQLLALENGDRIKDKQRHRNSFAVEIDKKHAAQNLLNELSSYHGAIIRQMKQMVEIYIELAELETKRENIDKLELSRCTSLSVQGCKSR